MDLMDLGCSLLQSPFLADTIRVLGHFGPGVTGAFLSLTLLAYGFLCDNRKMKQAGLAVLLSITVAGILANLLKLGLQMPRPTGTNSYGFASGHTSTAFGPATAIGITFP